MSDFDDGSYKTWQEPKGGINSAPLGTHEKLWLYSKILLVIMAEFINWLLHTSNYALINTVGSDLFIADVLSLPDISVFSNVSIGTLINSILGLAAVATPAFLFSTLLERHHEIFDDPKEFFRDGLNIIVTALLLGFYLLVIASEFSVLYLRVVEESTSSVIPNISGEHSSFWPMLIMSIALICTNAAMGLAAAHIFHSTKKAFRGQ